MEVENKDLYSEFDKIDDVQDEEIDEIIAKTLYLGAAIEEDNLSVVDDLLIELIDYNEKKED